MPYNARVFQILIASPGDVLQEREAVAEIIHEWNDLNSRDRGLVLLPLRWETHSSPELGLPPQEVINRQVADYSDLVVGVFWTRLGTPTKDAVSGTAEEISRAVTAGKPVMLYFSKTKADLDTVDLDEYKKLREFRESIMPKGLVEQYSSLSEFRDKFSKQLAISIRDLVSHDTVQEQGERSLEAPPLSLALAQNSGDLCPPARLQLDYVLCTDETKIPDYETPFDRSVDPPGPFESVVTTGSSKRNYYRDLVKYYCQQKGYCAVRLAISNSGPEGVRDLYLELRLSGNGKSLDLLRVEDILQRPSENYEFMIGSSQTVFFNRPRPVWEKSGEEWQTTLELPVVQAQRTWISEEQFYIGANESMTLTLSSTAYSSTSIPFLLEANVDLEVRRRQMSFRDILKELKVDPPSMSGLS